MGKRVSTMLPVSSDFRFTGYTTEAAFYTAAHTFAAGVSKATRTLSRLMLQSAVLTAGNNPSWSAEAVAHYVRDAVAKNDADTLATVGQYTSALKAVIAEAKKSKALPAWDESVTFPDRLALASKYAEEHSLSGEYSRIRSARSEAAKLKAEERKEEKAKAEAAFREANGVKGASAGQWLAKPLFDEATRLIGFAMNGDQAARDFLALVAAQILAAREAWQAADAEKAAQEAAPANVPAMAAAA